jgi:RNA polymerase sigma factor (sigma-70 family)
VITGIDWNCPVFLNDYRVGAGGALDAVYRQHVGNVEYVVRNGFRVAGDRPAFVRGVRNDLERADLVQEVFLRAFASRARETFDAKRTYEHYLLGITRHVLVDWHRANRRRRRLAHSLQEAACVAPSKNSDLPDELAPSSAVERYVNGLGQPLREVFELRIVGNRSQRETALALGLSRQNVRTLERRLRARLKKAIRFQKEKSTQRGPVSELDRCRN